MSALVEKFKYWFSLRCSCPTDPVLYVAIITCALMLTGCKATKPDIERVLVPVIAECPEATLPNRPRLPLLDLPENATPDEVARAYAESLEAVIGHCEQLETLLKGYTSNTPRKPE